MVLNQGLTFLAVSTGFMVLIVGGFLVKLLIDLSKLVKNVDDTTTIVKSEIEPTLQELNKALKSINTIAQNADKQVNTLAKTIENFLGTSAVVFYKAKNLSGNFLKGLIKGIVAIVKMFLKNK